MDPKTNTQTVPTGEPSQNQQQQTQDNDSQSLVQRVAKFMETNDPSKSTVQVEDDFKFDVNEISKIEDPKAREVAEKAYKSFQKGWNKKYQELADLRKTLEQNTNSKWTPERVQQLVTDQEFLQAAKQVVGTQAPTNSGLTDDEWSALNDKEKAQLVVMQNEINALKQNNIQNVRTQQDAYLKQTYANYNPQVVDQLMSDMERGRVVVTREHFWKVHDYDSAVKRAYSLGRQDERNGNTERVASMSTQGISTQSNQTIQPEKDESSMNFFKRIASKRLAESKAGQQHM